MKTYTRKEFVNVWGYVGRNDHLIGRREEFNVSGNSCSCKRIFGGVLKSFIECANCLGMGRAPIPWTEVRGR